MVINRFIDTWIHLKFSSLLCTMFEIRMHRQVVLYNSFDLNADRSAWRWQDHSYQHWTHRMIHMVAAWTVLDINLGQLHAQATMYPLIKTLFDASSWIGKLFPCPISLLKIDDMHPASELLVNFICLWMQHLTFPNDHKPHMFLQSFQPMPVSRLQPSLPFAPICPNYFPAGWFNVSSKLGSSYIP